MWAKYRIDDVCTPEALINNREQVIEFHNIRLNELRGKEPNAGHYALTELKKYYDVEVVTQNIDDLPARAGNTKVNHIHAELMQIRTSKD